METSSPPPGIFASFQLLATKDLRVTFYIEAQSSLRVPCPRFSNPPWYTPLSQSTPSMPFIASFSRVSTAIGDQYTLVHLPLWGATFSICLASSSDWLLWASMCFWVGVHSLAFSAVEISFVTNQMFHKISGRTLLLFDVAQNREEDSMLQLWAQTRNWFILLGTTSILKVQPNVYVHLFTQESAELFYFFKPDAE